MTIRNKILTLIAAVVICLLAQSYDQYMGVMTTEQTIDLLGD
ncbi:hypothetical protein [Acinetobacter genomosp. 15BJ]|uniref:Uncharacterized protein n=1 Tax=Acinetobacter genomosp. 15BJ TaxID=106651 RepID=R9B796_9GAMM|nr:hypothetical protein [Acinetobacter genomosp. 15BJ]EOR10384.1 hypothetical protein F896_00512 [Acinetobacter genomosp. 15BJ]MDO3656810.1 hypothetical protein [Acinetobacter genomosp. 15BJ]